jgi:uridine phosphorylase
VNFAASEKILNDDGSIYHLHLHAHQVPDTLLLVGDPERVPKVSGMFDQVEERIHAREFHTHIGRIGNTSLAVISTGIGTDNIDIVLNELDVLVNEEREERKSLRIIRLGTSGCVNETLPVGTLVYSEFAIGTEGLMNFYDWEANGTEESLASAFSVQVDSLSGVALPYAVEAPLNHERWKNLADVAGITVTCNGFYAPQGRQLLAPTRTQNFLKEMAKFQWNDRRITNFEMETAGILGLSKLMGHRAASYSAILANRQLGTFHPNPEGVVRSMIERVLGELG